MKKLSLLIIPITVFALGVLVFTSSNKVEAAYGDRASYTLTPWTFWQTGVTTEDWNSWELNSFNRVDLAEDSNIYSDSVAADGSGSTNFRRTYIRSNTDPNSPFYHRPIAAHPASQEPYQIPMDGTSHSFTANIESNGWSGKWLEDETQEHNYPPKWPETRPSVTTTKAPETTTKREIPIDNDPYTLRCWATAKNLKKNRTYTWTFSARIDEGARRSKEDSYSYGETVPATDKYVKIVGTNDTGSILFVRYLTVTTKTQNYKFNFSLDKNSESLKVEYMFGAFIKVTGPVIKHKEVCWTGVVHIDNCDVYQGNLNEAPESETTRRRSSGGGDWEEEPAKIKSVKVKSKAKKSVLISWKKDENATKYQIKYGLKKNFKGAKSKKTSKKKITIKGLKSKKVYYFKVRGLSDMGNGPWSARKKCKVK